MQPPARRPTITLLGRVAVDAGGRAPTAAAPRGRRAELAFALLAAEHCRVVTHDELAEALWPAGLPNTWEAALRGVMTEVRRYLADAGLDANEILVTARRGYRLLVADVVDVDLDVAREALDAARAHLAAGAPAAAAARAAQASALARLPFLPNHEGEWVDGVRRDLATTVARALEVEARAHADADDLAAAATAAERLVQVEPFNEAAHQLRIRVLGRAGDRAGAIRAYEHCRDVLAAELGVEPSEETTATYRATIAPEASRPPSPPAAVPAGPTPVTTDTAEGLAAVSVLVVEDHDFQRRTAMMLLRNLGVGTVQEAEDGGAALQLLAGSDRPDVILCDIDMPGMDGVEFIRHVAEGELADAVIIASALDAKVLHAVQAVGEGYGLQVLGAIEKPITARRLGELLAAYGPRRRPRPASGDPDGGAEPPTAAEVERALVDGRITFHLRPAVDVATGAVTSAQAVPRWHEPGAGGVPAGAFLPVLARHGLLPVLSARGLDAACALLGPAGAVARLGVAVAIDLAPEGLGDAELADRAARTARAAGVEPSRLTFALDERVFRSNQGAALGLLTRLRVKGFGVSLDRFGAGHAPAEVLRGVPLTEVQLAAQLVTGAAADPGRAAALEEAVEVARGLDVTVVGDGCEGDDDLALLLALGCDRVQGGFVAEAMEAEAFPGWIAGWDPQRLDVGGRG